MDVEGVEPMRRQQKNAWPSFKYALAFFDNKTIVFRVEV
jgi:hypothetical protein